MVVSERSPSPGALTVAFAGTPAFAAVALRAIAGAGFTIPLVLTRPDKPKGRGLRETASDVAIEAAERGLTLLQPPTLRLSGAVAELRSRPVDVLVVAAYGLILPQDVLDWPAHGALNIHASALPRWRGAAPIQRALMAGDAATGVSIMQMDAGLDTGPVIRLVPVGIASRETGGSLHDRLAAVGAATIVDVLHVLARDRRLPSTPQPVDGVTYAHKIGREDASIDWRRDAVSIDRQVRALDPSPGAQTTLRGQPLKLWRVEPAAASGTALPGTVVGARETLDVATGDGVLRVRELQPAGGRRMDARAFVAGRAVAPGDLLGAPADA